MNTRKFHSSYIIDVSICRSEVIIIDSMRSHWRIDISNDSIRSEFKNWLHSVFLAGIPQTLTVFEYEQRGDVPDVENWITKFHNIKPSQING